MTAKKDILTRGQISSASIPSKYFFVLSFDHFLYAWSVKKPAGFLLFVYDIYYYNFSILMKYNILVLSL